MKGVSQAIALIVAVVISAAILFFGIKVIGKSQQQVSGLVKSGDLEQACAALGIYIKGDQEDRFVDQVPASTARDIALTLKAACGSKEFSDLADAAAKCMSGSGGEGCTACSSGSGMCISIQNGNLQNAIKVCENLKSVYHQCEMESPGNIMSCITDKKEKWCST